MKSLALAITLLFLAVSCVGELGSGGDDVEPEEQDTVAGTYELTSSYDLSTSDALPGLLGDALGPLTGLRDDPGATILTILENTGGAIGDLIGLLPSSLRAELEAEINDFVAAQIAGGAAAGDIIMWVDQIADILTNFQVISHFEIGSVDGGVANANHRLAAVGFVLDGQMQRIDTPEVIDTLTIARDVECQVSGAEISIAEHAFHLPLGQLAVTGFNQVLQSTLGAADVGQALAMVIDCADVAASIGPLCIDVFCIDESEIADVCSDGLAAVAAEIEGLIAEIDFAELRLSGGRAALEDAAKQDGFGQIDRWAGGSWTTAFEIDGLVVPVEASFIAERL